MNHANRPRRSALRAPFGFVVIDKPPGLTSHACVSRLRRCYGLKRVGHGGTLDPAVTGVLPIALGQATRLLPYLPGEKTYSGLIQLGTTTDSDDLEGEIIRQRPHPHLRWSGLDAVLDRFRGVISQRPPQVSAIHINGERAYTRARRGEAMEIPARTVIIHRLELLHWDVNTGRLQLNVHCSAGTYIRSLARDLGETLGCGACLASLRRTQALGFDERQATALPNPGEPPPEPSSPLIALGHLPRRQLSATEEIDWRCGRRIERGASIGDTVIILNRDGSMAGIALNDGPDRLRPKVVFDAKG